MRFSLENYKKFYKVLGMLSNLTADVQIVNSKIAQLGNGSVYNIYADLTPILVDCDIESICLYNIENKLPLMKTFKESSNDFIDFEIDKESNEYVFSDGISEVSIRVPDMRNYICKFDETLHKEYDDSTKLMECELDKTLIKRLVNSASTLETEVINAEFDKESKQCKLFMTNSAKTSTVTLISKLKCNPTSNSVTMKHDCFKTSVGNSVNVSMFQRNTERIDVVFKTEVEGCYIEYRQGRRCF